MKVPHLLLGSLLLLVAAVIAAVCITHRPSDGLVETVKRFNEGAIKPWAFYSLITSAVLLGSAGIGQLVTGLRSDDR